MGVEDGVIDELAVIDELVGFCEEASRACSLHCMVRLFAFKLKQT